MSVLRCFTEKRQGHDLAAKALQSELTTLVGIKEISSIRIFARYDIEGLADELYGKARDLVLAEAQCDIAYDEQMPSFEGSPRILAVEPLPGQYDQRSDSAAQCIELLTAEKRPIVAAAMVYVFFGNISDSDFAKISEYLINPVESRTADMAKPTTLIANYEIPTEVETLTGFIETDKAGLETFLGDYGLAMDIDDLEFLQGYFRDTEKRDPTITEVRMIDTYWSDHCRHTTFLTQIDSTEIDDEIVKAAFDKYLDARKWVYGEEKASKRPVTLMDMGTIGTKYLKECGYLKNLDESEEINACSIRVNATIDGQTHQYLLMFKNETHNHPTEIEPFGGAATCLGGAIRDPLSGRSYVYQAMRVTGAGDPTVPLSETLAGKLSQRKICRTAAAGYSSYGNQIGLATGLVHEVYHEGYVAKRLEIGAVVGAAPVDNVVRERPEATDVVILLGGATGRDGCGGATGSSKSHTAESLASCGAEVQKGNPPEERKIQRLFRNAEVTKLIRRCNDFGAGGVSVAIGELADGLLIDLDAVPKKYDGLDGTELAISESQERMAVVVRKDDADKFIMLANEENITAVKVADVTEERRLRMTWNGKTICDISRDFLDSNGVSKHVDAKIPVLPNPSALIDVDGVTVGEKLINHLGTLNVAMEQGLINRFDSTIGASSVLVPFGGKTQTSPTQVMAATLPTLEGTCSTASIMSFGFDPYLTEQNPFLGASFAVIDSVAKIVAAGGNPERVYLTFQEYFERLRRDPVRFGKPVSALLGAYSAQENLKIAAIGGKDSMSGSFNEMDVPPTFVSFAIVTQEAENIISPELKSADNYLYCFDANINEDGTPNYTAIKEMWKEVNTLISNGVAVSAWAITNGGVAEGIAKMAFGNEIGVEFDVNFPLEALFIKNYGGIIVETTEELPSKLLIGKTIDKPEFIISDEVITIADMKKSSMGKLDDVYKIAIDGKEESLKAISFNNRSTKAPAVKCAKPTAVIPVFPGTNCEYDTAKAIQNAGGNAEIIIVKNRTHEDLQRSAEQLHDAISKAQMIILPGGFSGGDEPDGSGKFIASFLRNPAITEQIHNLLNNRDGLMLGICNGFQALIKLGLVPYGEIRDLTENDPTLTFNLIGRHQSMYSSTRVASVMSPWLANSNVGDIHEIAMSHGEGRFVAPQNVIDDLVKNGQVAFQYVDTNGDVTMDGFYNPNGSMCAIEGITSPDGRVLGKMGHSERYSPYTGKNIYGQKYQPLFESGVKYFK